MDKKDTFTMMSVANIVLDEYICAALLPDKLYRLAITDENLIAINKFSIASFIILATKEDIIEKKDKYRDNLLFSIMSDAADKIAAKQNDGSYKIGNVSFEDPANLVSRIRNKIAHGDYTLNVDNKSVVLNFDEGPAEISIDNIVFLSRFLMMKISEFRKVDEYDRLFALGMIPTATPINKKVKTDKDLDFLIDSFCLVLFNISTEQEYIPKEAYRSFQLLKVQLQMTLAKKNVSTKTNIIKMVSDILRPSVDAFNKKYNDTKLDISVRKPNPEEKEILKDLIKGTMFYDQYNIRDLASIIGPLVMRVLDNRNDKFFLLGASSDLIEMLDVIDKTKEMNINDVAEKMSTATGRIDINQDNLCLSLIYRFLTLSYAYENFNINLEDFDFSLLNPIINNNDDVELKNINIQCDSDKKKIVSCKSSIKDTYKHYKGLHKTKNCTNKKEKIKDQRNRLINLLKSLVNLYKMSYIHDKERASIERDRRINKDYYNNKNILEGIRNALSHGNIQIIPTPDLEDTIIEITDMYKGEEVFKIRCSYKELKETIDNIYNKRTLCKDKIKIK